MKKQIDNSIYLHEVTQVVDIHTHVLPQMDDGSHSVEESLEMLRLLRRQGVDTVVATPHFYPTMECPDDFIYHRSTSAEMLVKAAKGHEDELPKVCLGAELPYFEGIGNSKALPLFCFDGTKTVLVEMPFKKWSEATVNEIIKMKRVSGLDVAIAHIERYAKYQSGKTLDRLISEGIAFQMNCEAFDRLIYRTSAFNLMKRGGEVLIGTDCHDLSLRKPNMDEAVMTIGRKLGAEAVGEIFRACEARLVGAKYIW